MKLTDLKCSVLRFQPGDKIIARYRVPLDFEQRRSLQRKLERWAGSGVEVLLLDENYVDLEILRGTK